MTLTQPGQASENYRYTMKVKGFGDVSSKPGISTYCEILGQWSSTSLSFHFILGKIAEVVTVMK